MVETPRPVDAPVQPLVVLGTHHFAPEVLDLVSETPGFRVDAFVENLDRARTDEPIEGLPVLWIDDAAELAATHLAVCALGTTKRRRIVEEAQALGFRFATVVHPLARVSARSELGEGTIASVGVVVAERGVLERDGGGRLDPEARADLEVRVRGGLRVLELVAGDGRVEVVRVEPAADEHGLDEAARGVRRDPDRHATAKLRDELERAGEWLDASSDLLRHQHEQGLRQLRGVARPVEQALEDAPAREPPGAEERLLVVQGEGSAVPAEELGLGARPQGLAVDQQPVAIEDDRGGTRSVVALVQQGEEYRRLTWNWRRCA